MSWFKTIFMALIAVMVFFAFIIWMGMLDIGEQTNAEVLKNIFAGSYFFFAAPIFIVAWLIFSIGGPIGWGKFIFRLVFVLALAVGFYYVMAKLLVERISG